MKKLKEYGYVTLAASLCAFAYHIFVLSNSFAPAGIAGLLTMVQYVFHFQLSYMSLIVNLPLCIFAYFAIDKDYGLKSIYYNFVFSGLLIVLANPNFDFIIYRTGYSGILGPIAAGIIVGYTYGLVFRNNASGGGVDVIGCYVHLKNPEKDIFGVILTINCSVAILSYFVYGFNMEPVLMCITYCFFSAFVGNRIMKGGKEVIKFEVITEFPEEIAQVLMTDMHRGVTLIPCEGMYSHQKKGMLLCVVDKRQIVDFITIVQQYPNTFTTASTAIQTVGNFVPMQSKHHIKIKKAK